jgi:hypothetical protein
MSQLHQQTEMDFTIHAVENNPESQMVLDANRPLFKNQCKKVYEALCRGERLTTASALINYQIGDLRARIRDIRNSGINVQDTYIDGRFKSYFLTLD